MDKTWHDTSFCIFFLLDGYLANEVGRGKYAYKFFLLGQKIYIYINLDSW